MRRKPAACSKVLGRCRDLLELLAGAEAAVLVAMGDDVQRGALGDAGDVAQQRPGSGVEIDADAVDAALDDLAERLLQLALIDVVLILADADGFGIDLDEFGERVLQTAGDGDGSAHGEVEVGKLLARDVGSGVDAGAGFAHRDGEDVVELALAEELADEGRSRARRCRCRWRWRGRCAGDQRGERGFRAVMRCPCRGVRIDDVVGEELAGLIDDGDLAAGAQAGVDAEHGDLPGGRGEQQVVQVVAEDLNGFGVGARFSSRRISPWMEELSRRFQLSSMASSSCGVQSPVWRAGHGNAAWRCARSGSSLDEEVEDVFVSPRRMASMRCEGMVFTGSR
jgi:hypothetical protein